MAWQIIDRLQSAEPSAEPVLDAALKERITAEFDKYPTKRAALLTALHWVQEKEGHLSDQAMCEVAEVFDLSPAEVLDTASFYEMYTREKRGRHLIGVCRSLSCELCGHENTVELIRAKLGIGPGETTEDGKFSVILMECIGGCEFAPAILVDEKMVKVESPEQLEKALQEID